MIKAAGDIELATRLQPRERRDHPVTCRSAHEPRSHVAYATYATTNGGNATRACCKDCYG